MSAEKTILHEWYNSDISMLRQWLLFYDGVIRANHCYIKVKPATVRTWTRIALIPKGLTSDY